MFTNDLLSFMNYLSHFYKFRALKNSQNISFKKLLLKFSADEITLILGPHSCHTALRGRQRSGPRALEYNDPALVSWTSQNL